MKMELFMIYKFSLFLWLNLGILAQARREVLKQTMRPHFDRPSENVTVVIGSFAVLPCYVNNIGDHKVNLTKILMNLFKKLYPSFVRPQLEFASSVWNKEK